MHSRIFKLQYDLEKEYERIMERDFEDNGFLDGFHDYVADRGKQDDIENYKWLVSCYSQLLDVHKKDDGYYYLTIKKENVKTFLWSKIDKVKELLSSPLENMDWYGVKQCIDGDKCGFYFYLDYGYYTDVELCQDLMKWWLRDKDEITFRLEGSLDYHC